jgi:hypothetical protein
MRQAHHSCMTQENDPRRAASAVARTSSPKGSTNELPMLDLATILDFLAQLDEKGLQTLPQVEVAKQMGYSSQTSTPYYRRAAASKLFGLLDTNQGMVLTRLALDFFKPTDADAKQNALQAAVRNVVAYQKIIERYSEKRPPSIEILANLIEREYSLSREAARTCASVFLQSVQTAGMIDSNGCISLGSRPAMKVRQDESAPPNASHTSTSNPTLLSFSEDSETHFMTLDRKTGRKVIMQGPSVITESELQRLQSWLAVQFEVVHSLDEIAAATRDESRREP